MKKPLRPCAHPMCPNLTRGKYCEEHIDRLEKENKRYREALEEIARGRFPGASYKARQALEEEDEE